MFFNCFNPIFVNDLTHIMLIPLLNLFLTLRFLALIFNTMENLTF